MARFFLPMIDLDWFVLYHTKKELIIADKLFFVTPTGFKPVTF